MNTIRHFFTLVLIVVGTSFFAQAKRDTIFIYDTIRISVPRTTQQPADNFFEEPSATFSKDSIIIDETQKQSTMSNFRQSANQLIRRIAVGAMAATSSISPNLVKADTISEPPETPITNTVVKQIIEVDSVITPLKKAPLYLSFAYPLGLYGADSDEYVFNMAFSVLTGSVGGINGIQWAGIYNQVSDQMQGIQWAGIMNLTGSVEGIQWAGIANFAKDIKGIQWAGIFNQSHDMQGFQWAAIANAADHVKGMQWAGIYNAADSLEGMQWAAIANEAKDVHGAQFAGIYNKAESVRGVQFGLINSTKTLSGVQFGLINKVDTIEKGVSIGLFNFLKKDRFQELELSYNTYQTTFLNYRLGGRKLHALLGVGTSWEHRHLEWRLGFGNQTRLLKSDFYLQPSIFWTNSSYYHRNFWQTYQDNWTSLTCGIAYYWGNKIGFKITPALNYWVDWNRPWRENNNNLTDRVSYDFALEFGLSVKL
ncbi:MAG: hypothetical protein FWG79_05400 [Bacteroidales bacterium]|nr:hypothetical protein [Bacteroidales bacterium]